MRSVCSALLLFCAAAGCESDDVRPVWIATVQPAEVMPGALVTLRGRGFGSADIVLGTAPLVDAAPDAGSAPVSAGFVFEAENAVLVGGVPAEVLIRRDTRVDLRVPDVAPGPVFVVVFTQGTASNAVPLTVKTRPAAGAGPP